jgi:hypothetical protein
MRGSKDKKLSRSVEHRDQLAEETFKRKLQAPEDLDQEARPGRAELTG